MKSTAQKITLKLIFLFFLSLMSTAMAAPQFSVGEHQYAGDHLTIHWQNQTMSTGNLPLSLPNGAKLTYGQALMLGDFYGVADEPISFGDTEADRETRFLNAYATFSEEPTVITELNNILAAVNLENKLIVQAYQFGQPSSQIYNIIGDNMTIRYNCLTGGGCNASTWWLKPGRYIKLAVNNFDHFGNNAVLAYVAGHQAALKEALAARQNHDLSKLQNAYAMNAFACHFISDLFSSGHIRTPRVALAKLVKPSLASFLLVKYMHDEDDALGVEVENLAGAHWKAYGDHYYLEAKNDVSSEILNQALQVSLDEVQAAYDHGVLPSGDSVSQLIPRLATPSDTYPMFNFDVKSNTLTRRKSLNDVHSAETTTHWSGIGTLLALKSSYHLSKAEESTLEASKIF